MHGARGTRRMRGLDSPSKIIEMSGHHAVHPEVTENTECQLQLKNKDLEKRWWLPTLIPTYYCKCCSHLFNRSTVKFTPLSASGPARLLSPGVVHTPHRGPDGTAFVPPCFSGLHTAPALSPASQKCSPPLVPGFSLPFPLPEQFSLFH